MAPQNAREAMFWRAIADLAPSEEFPLFFVAEHRKGPSQGAG